MKEIIVYRIGKSCHRWRQSMGYTVKQICDETGYCQSLISKYENGHNNNAALFMWYIAHGFDVDSDFYIGDMGVRRSAADLWEDVND